MKEAVKKISCDLSGIVTNPNSTYYTYHPFMEDIRNGRVYTIKKKIIVSIDYIDLFPNNLNTYEEWYCRCGDNCLEPYQLGLSRKK